MSEEHGDSGAKIVVIGGGTGSFTLLTGLKKYVSDLTALVNMARDSCATNLACCRRVMCGNVWWR